VIAPDWLLLDTHIWFWWVEQDSRLPKGIARRIEEGPEKLAISAVAIYELVLQRERGRIEIDLPVDEWLQAATIEAEITVLPVDANIARTAALLPLHHGDPLDRITIATTICHNALLASIDTQFPRYEALAGRLIQT
jgi:PIN domain nuclease of toxin-antitoxin system